MSKLNVEFLQTGGVPLTNDLMAVLQDAYSIYEVLGDIAGDKTILKGCEINGSNVNPGIVAVNGEVLPFEGGLLTSTVYIQLEEFTEIFQDQTDKILVRRKTVKFGNSSTFYNWSDFKRLDTLKKMQEQISNSVTIQQHNAALDRISLLELKTAPIVNGGVVWAWFKNVNDIPTGWKECTNIRGKTIVGWNPNDPDFSIIGNSAGNKTIQLTVSQLPKIKFQYTRTLPWASGSSGGFGGGGNQFNIATTDTNELGNNAPINIMIPHTIAAFIEPNFQ